MISNEAESISRRLLIKIELVRPLSWSDWILAEHHIEIRMVKR